MSQLHNAQFDVLIIGAGAAGIYTALCLPNNLRVALITKDTISLSASEWAQGGIAAAIAPEDSAFIHIEDTLRTGAGLGERTAITFLAQEAPRCIQSLIEMGVAFDRQGDDLALTLEAAHSRRRVLHAADTTGREVITTLTAQVLQRQNIEIIQQALALSLWLHPQTGHCQGVSLVYQEQICWVRARAVVLATGGGGQVFAQTTNPSISTGDGVALAWRAGALLRDLEFVQFHPTALSKPGANHFLISEAVRGEGAHLIDKQGRRFLFDYHPAGELAPRDVVSRAIFSHLQQTAPEETANVWLDMRPIEPSKIRYRFPNIIQVCQSWGIDVLTEPIPVAPAAHYWMGGIKTDLMNSTSIPYLYAVGETASTGVHGANRLASNSLLECIVFGAQMADISLNPSSLAKDPTVQPSLAVPTVFGDVWSAQFILLKILRQALPRLMWQSAGICRYREGLAAATLKVETWRQEFTTLPLSQFLLNLPPGQLVHLASLKSDKQLRLWAETSNLLDIAYLILKSATFRTESRGGHYRLDYPNVDPSWQVHTMVQKDEWFKSA